MALTILHSEGYVIAYHKCHSIVPYNHLSEQSILQILVANVIV